VPREPAVWSCLVNHVLFRAALNEVIYSQPYQTHDDHSFVFLMKVADPGSVAPRTLYGVCCYVRELVHRPPSLAKEVGCSLPRGGRAGLRRRPAPQHGGRLCHHPGLWPASSQRARRSDTLSLTSLYTPAGLPGLHRPAASLPCGGAALLLPAHAPPLLRPTFQGAGVVSVGVYICACVCSVVWPYWPRLCQICFCYRSLYSNCAPLLRCRFSKPF
jgi:hypothetical protein